MSSSWVLPFQPGDICLVTYGQVEVYESSQLVFSNDGPRFILAGEIVTVLDYRQDTSDCPSRDGTRMIRRVYHTFTLLYKNKIWYADWSGDANLEVIKCDQ